MLRKRRCTRARTANSSRGGTTQRVRQVQVRRHVNHQAKTLMTNADSGGSDRGRSSLMSTNSLDTEQIPLLGII